MSTSPPCHQEGESQMQLQTSRMNVDSQSNNTFRRSQHGCWTCRLRRKKCDESPGSCLVCTDRGLHCAGYGKNKPPWMDGSVRQEAVHKEIKATVAAVTRMKRIMRSADSQPIESTSPAHDSLKELRTIEIDSNLSQSTSSRPKLKNLDTRIFSGTCDYLDSNGAVEQEAIPSYSSDFYSLPTPENSENTSSDTCFPPTNFIPDTSSTSVLAYTVEPKSSHDGFSYLQTTNPQPQSQSQAQQLQMNENTESWARPNLTNLNKAIITQVNMPPTLREGTQATSPISRKRTYDMSNSPAHYNHQNQPDIHYNHDYHEVTPWISSQVSKWPKLSSTNSRSRTEVSRSLQPEPQRQDVTSPMVRTQPYSRLDERGSILNSISEVTEPTVIASTTTSNAITDTDTTSNKLIQYEKLLLNSSGQARKDHLHNATSLLASRMIGGSIDYGSELTSAHTQDNLSLVHKAVRFIVWLEVTSRSFSSAYDNSPIRGSISRILLSCKPSPDHTIVPHDDWIIMFLERVNLLQQRNNHPDKSSRPNIHDLSQQTIAIQTQLEYFSAIDDDLALDQTPSGSALLCRMIFIHSLLLYLHVITSGPFSESPRIRRSVKVVLESLNALDDAVKLADSLIWPFCITGCLAGPEYHDSLKKHYRAGLTMCGGVGSNPRLTSAFMIMQECWRLRGRGIHAEWRIAKESLEQRGQDVGVGCW